MLLPALSAVFVFVPVAQAADLDGSLLTAAPTGAPPRTALTPTATAGIHMTESVLAGIIVGCVLGGVLLGLVTSAGIVCCLNRRQGSYLEFDEDDEMMATGDSHEKGVPLSPLTKTSPYPPSPYPPARPPRAPGRLSLADDGFMPTLPTIAAAGRIGTPTEWEAERTVSGAEDLPPSVSVPLGYSEYRATPPPFWKRASGGFTIRSAKAKARRASIVTLSSKSAKSRRASILTARSKLSGKSGRSAGKRPGALPIPPLPFSRRVPVPPLSPSLQPTRPPRRPRKRVMHQILPDPPAQQL